MFDYRVSVKDIAAHSARDLRAWQAWLHSA